MSTGPVNPERPREDASEFAELHRALRVESPADTIVPQVQSSFNRVYRGLVGMGLDPGQERADVADLVDRQALKTFSAFEHGRSIEQHDDAATKARRFNAWLNHLAATLGFQMNIEHLYLTLLERGTNEWETIFASQDEFEKVIIRAYRELSRLSEALTVQHWVAKDVSQSLQNWPEPPGERRRLFAETFRNLVMPEIRRQWEANRQVPIDQEVAAKENARFAARMQNVLGTSESLAERASDSEDARHLLNVTAQQAVRSIFSADEPTEDVLKEYIDAGERLDRFHALGGVWVPPLQYTRAELPGGQEDHVRQEELEETPAREPAPQDSAHDARSGSRSAPGTRERDESPIPRTMQRETQEPRATTQLPTGRNDDALEPATSSSPSPTLATQLQQAEDWLRRWGNPFSYTGVNNKFTRLLFAPTIFVYGKVLPYFWRRPRYAAATVGGAVLGGISGGPVGAVVGATIGATAGRKWRTPETGVRRGQTPQ